MRFGLIKDTLPQALEQTGTKVCYLYSAHVLQPATLFILSNYIPFDEAALDLGIATRNWARPTAGGIYTFDVAIPATYSIVSESGNTAGILDGAPYAGPVPLAAGRRLFRRTAGAGRAAIFLERALALGFHPLFERLGKVHQNRAVREKNRPFRMTGLRRTLNRGEADASMPSKSRAAGGWADRYLPPAGFERAAFLVLAALVSPAPVHAGVPVWSLTREQPRRAVPTRREAAAQPRKSRWLVKNIFADPPLWRRR